MLRKYFRGLMKVKEEPADIHPEFVKITKLVIEANRSQKDLQPKTSQQSKPLRSGTLTKAAAQ